MADDVISATTSEVRVVDVLSEADRHIARGTARLSADVLAAISHQIDSSRIEAAAVEAAVKIASKEYDAVSQAVSEMKCASSKMVDDVEKLRPQLEQLDALDAAMDQLLSLANELASQTREMEAAVAAVVAPER